MINIWYNTLVFCGIKEVIQSGHLFNTFKSNINYIYISAREGGDIRLFIIQVPKVLKTIFLFVNLIILGTFIEFRFIVSASWVSKRCKILKNNFVYHHLGCTPIYRSLSYPFRSLYLCTSFVSFIRQFWISIFKINSNFSFYA